MSWTGPPRADRTSYLDLVPYLEDLEEIWRDLTIFDQLHSDGQHLPLFGGRNGIAALRLISVLRGEPDVDVMAGKMTWPLRRGEHETADARAFVDELDNLGDGAVQSPLYRCSNHGSP